MSTAALRRHPMFVVLLRHPLLAAVVVAIVVLFAVSLLWHLVAVDHGSPMGVVGGCAIGLAVAFLAVAPRRASVPAVGLRPTDARSDLRSPDRVPRPPPGLRTLEGVVLRS